MSTDLPEMRNHAPASRLTGYRLFRIFGFDVRLNLMENDRLVGVISLKDLREFIALKLELESPEG
jgi:hypothetical protein